MSMVAIQKDSIAERVAWARDNLFNTRANTAITLVSFAAAALVLFLVVRYVLFQANWGLVALNRKLFFVGSYPAEEAFRIWIALFLAVGLIAITYGIWGGRLRPYMIVVGVVAALVLTLGLGVEPRIEERQFTEIIQSGDQSTTISGINRVLVMEGGWAPSWLYSLSLGLAVPFGSTWVLLAGVFGTLAGGAVIGKRFVAKYRGNQILLQGIGALWVLLIPAVVLLQIGVSTNHWESAFLDIIIFSVGVFFSFFIGLALAMGRVSAYRAIRISTVGYIEVVRAAPLLVWLLFATFLKGELGPVGEAFSSIDLVYRVMFVFAFFGGAYIAEVIQRRLAVGATWTGGGGTVHRAHVSPDVHSHHPAAGDSSSYPGYHRPVHRAVERHCPARGNLAGQHPGEVQEGSGGADGHRGGRVLRNLSNRRPHILGYFLHAVPPRRDGGITAGRRTTIAAR